MTLTHLCIILYLVGLIETYASIRMLPQSTYRQRYRQAPWKPYVIAIAWPVTVPCHLLRKALS